MKYLSNLVVNENMKINKRSRVWILLGLLVVINMFAAILLKIIFSGTNLTFWEYVEFSSYILLIVQLMCIIIAGDIVANEYTMGTIKLLLIRPANRLKILAAKYISVLLFIGFMVAAQFAFTFIFGLIFFWQSFMNLQDFLVVGNIFAKYFFGFIEIIIFCTLAFMFSTVSKSGSFSIAFPIFIIFSSSGLIALLSHYRVEYGKYLLFANTDLMQHFANRPVFDSMTWGFSLVNIGLHMAIFFMVTILFFTKRDVRV